MVVIVRSSFQEVVLDIFRKKSISKGQKLLDSCHVSDVREEIYNEGYRRLLGTVLRETPRAESKKKNENCYQVTIELNSDRTISDTVCSCKGGKGYCKHAAAVCIFVNVENTCSKTDVPMIWNKPSDAQLEKYAKGRRIEQMYQKKVESNNAMPSRVYRVEEVENITEEHLSLNYSMSKMLAAEKKCASEREKRERIRLENEENIRGIIDQLFERQLHNNRRSFHAYESTSSDFTIKLKLMQCPTEYSAVYSQLIEVDRAKWVDVCLNSIGQSQSAVWHAERYLRITCSSRVHRIKTRKENFEGLAKQFKNEKYRGTLTDDMRYGIETEPIARSVFESHTGLKVHEVGLVISLHQPFLACSPDGIIIDKDRMQLLEIKCPSSCKDSGIIDTLTNEIRVPYLKFDEEEQVVLKESHVYYTQVQVSMYILRLESCHFFVYSKSDYIHLIINRDDEFLKEVIPKAENFYYVYFIPLLRNYVQGF